MNSTVVARDNVVDAATIKEVVVVQVDQTAIPLPGTQEEQWGTLGIVTMDGVIVEENKPASASISSPDGNVPHSTSAQENKAPPSPRLSRSTSLSVLSKGSKRRANSSPKKDKGLRLPSFKGLGISSWEPRPHPTQAHNNRQQHEALYQPRLRRSDPRPRPLSNFQHSSEPIFRSTPLLTPPEDHDSIKWNNALLSPSAPSTFRTTQTDAPYSSALNTSEAAMEDRGGLATVGVSVGQEGSQSHSTRIGSSDMVSNSTASNNERWFDQAIEEAEVGMLDTSPHQSRNVSLVAQVLPLPAEDSSPHHEIFASTVQSIQSHFAVDDQPFISITHAVPHKFDLNKLPTSPPATPNPVQAEDYFGQQSIFSHAAVVPAYHGPIRQVGSSAPTTPNPIVPPSSVQISVLERYIPPISTQECNDFFSKDGQSCLVDRLCELSTNGGSLLLIYPTKNGGRTFTSSYLSPVLDPTLMHIVNLNGLVFDLAADIGRMTAVSQMSDLPTLKRRLESLCKSVGERTPRSRYGLVHSSVGKVSLDQATWRQWYVAQEQARIRDVLRIHWRMGRRLPADTSVTDATIARQIIDAVEHIPDSERRNKGQEVEVGVFVVRRSPISPTQAR